MNRLRRRRFRRDQRGQALVEFALVLPILLILLLGIIDFARAWNVYQVLTDAGREGAREAVVANGLDVAAVQTVVIDAAGRAGIGLATSDVTVTLGADRGDPTTVTISYSHPLRYVGWALGLFGSDGNIPMTVVSTMRTE
jgi:Flp pilus assembly protein TadG